MPLDRVNGEVIDGFDGSAHVTIDPRSLASMDNLKTEYKIKSKFRIITKRRSIFDDAVAHAITAFEKEGALRPIRFDEDDVLVQVYPKECKCAVVFQRAIAGKDYYVTRFYDLPRPVIAELITESGKKALEH